MIENKDQCDLPGRIASLNEKPRPQRDKIGIQIDFDAFFFKCQEREIK